MPRGTTAGRPSYRCAECGWQASKWVGRCGECQAWGSVGEAGVRLRKVGSLPVTVPAQPIVEVDAVGAAARVTGVPELDRVLGGGLVPGAVVLLAGEPGVGKSTLLLEVAAQAARSGRRALYVTGEESAAQVKLRAVRIGALEGDLLLAAEDELGAVVAHVEAVQPDFLVVDSVQTVSDGATEGTAGGVTQIRQVASTLIRLAKEHQMSTVLVGHVTKDGSVAGPRVLEHLVDVVLQFEGDRHSRLRMVRATKNRYGPSDEIGCFDLDEGGITGLADPSGLFLAHGIGPAIGTCVTATTEGRRALVCEVQALVSPSSLNNPRRATSGLDAARVSMILAVLERRIGLRLGDRDVYAATIGGVRLSEPGTDLATALAIASSALDLPLPLGLVAVGELGLAGEIRPVPGLAARIAESARLGFTTAVVPHSGGVTASESMEVLEVRDLEEALAAVGCRSRTVHSR
jgi:DNA repair protein RadA/Sms